MHGSHVVHQFAEAGQKDAVIGAALSRDAGCDDGIAEGLAARDSQAVLIEERALSLFSPEHFIAGRVENKTGDDLAGGTAAFLDRYRNAEVGDAVEKVGRTVERVDDPTML